MDEEVADSWEDLAESDDLKLNIERINLASSSSTNPTEISEDDWEVTTSATSATSATSNIVLNKKSYLPRGHIGPKTAAELGPEHVVELYDIPNVPSYELSSIFGAVRSKGAEVVEIGSNKAIAVFRNAETARNATHLFSGCKFKVRSYATASNEVKTFPLEQIPVPERQATTSTVANRLIKSALTDIKNNKGR